VASSRRSPDHIDNLLTIEDLMSHPHLLAGPFKRACRAVLLGALLLAVAPAVPSYAAGTYIHKSCVTGADLADAYGGWQPGGYTMAGNSNGNYCAWGGLHSEMFPQGPIPLGATVGWTYTAPPHTTISRFASEYAGWTKLYDDVNRGVIRILDGAGHVGLDYTDGQATIYEKKPFDWYGLATDAITADVLCHGPSGHPGCVGSLGWMSIYEPKLYLADDLPPTPGATAGSLTTDTTLKETERVSYSASDAGGGIARLRLFVDGQATAVDHVIDANNGHCVIGGSESGVWIFSWPKPCPGAVDAEEAIDTATIADGRHTITLKVVDAAQREATLWTGSRVVANHPPITTQPPLYADQGPAVNPVVGRMISVVGDGVWTGPNLNISRSWVQCDGHGIVASCAAIPGAVGHSYVPTIADVGHRLRLAVTATNPADSVTIYSQPTGVVAPASSAGPLGLGSGDDGTGLLVSPTPVLHDVSNDPTVVHAMRGRVAGEPAGAGCPQDRATLKLERVRNGQLELGFGKASAVKLRLTCTMAGKVIAGAPLDIATRVGSGAVVVTEVTTDGAGHAALRLAKGASRTVTVGYRMYADDAFARTTATLRVAVNGKVVVKASRTRLRNGQAVTLRGKLVGGEVPARGVTLAVQWKDGRRWRPFAQLKTNRKGAFHYAYRFTRTRSEVTYALRVQVTKGQIDYPYLPTASKPVKVIVG
jgi:hypothetical protein